MQDPRLSLYVSKVVHRCLLLGFGDWTVLQGETPYQAAKSKPLSGAFQHNQEPINTDFFFVGIEVEI
jgi:hypothetical protein